MHKSHWLVIALVLLANPAWADEQKARELTTMFKLVNSAELGTEMDRAQTMALSSGGLFVAATVATPVTQTLASFNFKTFKLNHQSPHWRWDIERDSQMAALKKEIMLEKMKPRSGSISKAIINPSVKISGLGTRRVVESLGVTQTSKLRALENELKAVKMGAAFPPRVRVLYRTVIPTLQRLLAVNALAGFATIASGESLPHDNLSLRLPAVYQGRKIFKAVTEPSISESRFTNGLMELVGGSAR
jgi:hypothetical protein